MAGITLEQAEAKLASWLAAETAIAERGQSYTIGDRRLDRADLKEIRASITYWNEQVQRLTPRSTARTRYVV